jgi:UDP-GlcNAc:undecaprenyl-phosphate GlcNAc-1-phosphate transferase
MKDFFLLQWFAVAAALTACFIMLLLKPAHRFDLIDHPVGRKNHCTPTPLIGGLAIFLGATAAYFFAGLLPVFSLSFMAAILVTLGIGLADDAHEIGHRSKFFAQIIAALLIVSGTEVHVMHFGDIFGLGDTVLDKWSYLVTVIAIIGLMNAINMIDGLDGLAGSQALIALTGFLSVSMAAGNALLSLELAILTGAVAGFLALNMRSPLLRRALTFMGDTGGLLLGLLLAWYAIRLGGPLQGAMMRPMTAVWLIAVPLLDMGAVMFLRILQRTSPFQADRQHLHYVLRDAGLSVSQVVWSLALLAAGLSCLALAAEARGISETVMFVAFLALQLAYVRVLARPAGITRLAASLATPAKVPDSGA